MDHEHSPSYETVALAKFANDADLVIYDAAYSKESYDPHQGYGHSTIEMGQRFRKQSGCRKIAFMGHSMERLDSEIPRLTERLDPTAEILACDGFRLVL
jgi:ribonuclease BN (tRNA processing enzyme)